MTGCGVGSRPATAARAATVLPAPTSPVMTPSRVSVMQKLIRAVAWAWACRANRSLAAIAFPNGVRASPKCAAHGARLAIAVLLVLRAGEHLQLGEVDRRAGAGLLVVRGGDPAEGGDPGRGRRPRWGPPGAGARAGRRGARDGRSRTAPRSRPACRPGTPRCWPGLPGRS